MLSVKITSHALYRWSKRVGTKKSAVDLATMFKTNKYVDMGIGYEGRRIVALCGYVFVISKEGSNIVVHTTFGREAEAEDRLHRYLDRVRKKVVQTSRKSGGSKKKPVF